MNFIPTHCIAHRDADGLVAGILVEKCFNILTTYTGYGKLEETVNRILAIPHSRVMICDISLTVNLYELHRDKFERGEVVVIDHHESSLPLVGQEGIYFDIEHAGSTLTYRWILENHPKYFGIIKPYLDLAQLTRDYDLWIHDDWRSIYWTAMIQMRGFTTIHDRWIKNPSGDFTSTEASFVKLIAEQRDETRKSIADQVSIIHTKDESHLLALYLVPEQWPTCMFEELSKFTKDNEIDISLIIYSNRKKASLRSSEMNLLETPWEELFRGHPCACGLKVERTVDEVFDMLADFYQTV